MYIVKQNKVTGPLADGKQDCKKQNSYLFKPQFEKIVT